MRQNLPTAPLRLAVFAQMRSRGNSSAAVAAAAALRGLKTFKVAYSLSSRLLRANSLIGIASAANSLSSLCLSQPTKPAAGQTCVARSNRISRRFFTAHFAALYGDLYLQLLRWLAGRPPPLLKRTNFLRHPSASESVSQSLLLHLLKGQGRRVHERERGGERVES